ncbi:triose-phosphate isomerase [Flavobacterium okayamense]|uniref:Triosephosphate isomerase n=1 Tax=Flavobacterium okayamense TaxID=2830782 RepID=A0ABM7S5W7_9FLAO|nr:triose-phosphate isomerase [Flavobacterium okayamense]BCY28890.1 triosephosphate isomerase [Flavobacterium okayamense]
MRKNIVAGNWKMHKTNSETVALLQEIITKNGTPNCEVIVAPTFINLKTAVDTVVGKNITVAAQNMHQAEGGAFTGEIAANMLTDIGVNTIILGHSERRAYFHETDALLASKVDTAMKHEMRVIFCFGEELKDRQIDNHFNIVEYQLRDGLFHLEKKDWKNIVLAYEPVWAIGTGETASPEQAQEMHKFIRDLIAKVYGHDVADEVTILYGGSVKPDNAKEIFSKPDVDGGLIGGASLKADDFLAIVNAF